MAMIEVEFAATQFESLIAVMVSSAPIPLPTFVPLGDDRLISSLKWSDANLVAELPEMGALPGRLLALAAVKIGHISIAELTANASAPGSVADATAWFSVSLVPGSMRVDMLAIVFAGAPPHWFSPPVVMGSNEIPLPSQAVVVGQAIVARDGIVTLRFATSPDDHILQPPSNRLSGGGGNWLIRISGDLLKDFVLDQLRDGVSPPPAGTVIEDDPTAAWSAPNVEASVGLEKVDACPGAGGSVDISVGVKVKAIFTTNVDSITGRTVIGINLNVESNVSDWDSFRCWLGNFGLGSLVLGVVVNPLVGIAAGLASIIGVSEVIRRAGGRDLGEVGSSTMVKVREDDTSVDYEGTIPVDAVARSSGASVSAEVNDGGIVIKGQQSILLRPRHKATFVPSTGTLPGTWDGDFNCSTRIWSLHYELSSVLVTDDAVIDVAGTEVHLAAVPVMVFPTSTAVPASAWRLHPPFEITIKQSVSIKCLNNQVAQTGMAFIHTSAGIRRFDLGPVPLKPGSLNHNQRMALEKYCDSFHLPSREIVVDELKWVHEPPDYQYGYPALRQWQLTVSELARDASLTLHGTQSRGGEDIHLATLTAADTGSASVEVVTDAATELKLRFSGGGGAPRARLTQRWLVPLHVVQLPGPAKALVRAGDTIGVLADDTLVMVSSKTWQSTEVEVDNALSLAASGDEFTVQTRNDAVIIRHGGLARTVSRSTGSANHQLGCAESRLNRAASDLPFSINLPSDRMAAVHGAQLIIAQAMGTAVQRGPRNKRIFCHFRGNL